MVSVGSREAEEKVPSEYNYIRMEIQQLQKVKERAEKIGLALHTCIMCIKIHTPIHTNQRKDSSTKNVFELENRGALGTFLCVCGQAFLFHSVWNGDGMAIVDGDEFAPRCSFVMSCAAGLFPFLRQLRGAPCVRYDGFKDGHVYRMSQSIRGIAPATTRQLLMPLGRNFIFKLGLIMCARKILTDTRGIFLCVYNTHAVE